MWLRNSELSQSCPSNRHTSDVWQLLIIYNTYTMLYSQCGQIQGFKGIHPKKVLLGSTGPPLGQMDGKRPQTMLTSFSYLCHENAKVGYLTSRNFPELPIRSSHIAQHHQTWFACLPPSVRHWGAAPPCAVPGTGCCWSWLVMERPPLVSVHTQAAAFWSGNIKLWQFISLSMKNVINQ